jgi:hypothetical protein
MPYACSQLRTRVIDITRYAIWPDACQRKPSLGSRSAAIACLHPGVSRSQSVRCGIAGIRHPREHHPPHRSDRLHTLIVFSNPGDPVIILRARILMSVCRNGVSHSSLDHSMSHHNTRIPRVCVRPVARQRRLVALKSHLASS